MSVEIPVYARDGSVKATFLVDDDQAEAISAYRWKLSTRGYIVRNVNRNGKFRTICLHRHLMGLEPGDKQWVDHINRNPLDNRLENLRLSNPQLNAQNRNADRGSTSTHRGVYLHRMAKRWVAQAWLAGTNYHLGTFESEDEAAAVVRTWRLEHMPHATG